jgi:hypothetical protein
MNLPLPPTAPITKNPQAKPREFVIKSQEALINSYAWECCLNCDHFTEHFVTKVQDETKYSGFREEDQGEMCTKFATKVPLKVAAVGCTEYCPAIPF